MSQKPPAFQFYAKDWRSSHNVARMTSKERGVYIDLLAAAWESEEPGTLPAPAQLMARCAGLDTRLVKNFLHKFPTAFKQLGDIFVNEKLHSQWIELKEYKQKQSLAGKKGNEVRWLEQSQPDSQPDRSASASASASSKEHIPTANPTNGEWHQNPYWPKAPYKDGVILDDDLTKLPIAKSRNGKWWPI